MYKQSLVFYKETPKLVFPKLDWEKRYDELSEKKNEIPLL